MKWFSEPLIVVTGAAGFIGSHVVRHLNARGIDQILLVDDLKTSTKWRNLVGKKFVDLIGKAEFPEWLSTHTKSVQAIIHLGACSSTVEMDAGYLLENNYHYSKRIAQAAIPQGIPFIYASSAATYGRGEQGFSDSEEAIDSLRPLNMYGYSKQLFDLWLKQQGLFDRAIGLKFFNVFGPNEGHKGRMASVIYHWTKAIQNTGRISLFKSSEPDKYLDGYQLRDFIDVDDAARMVVSFLDHPTGGLYNIGRGIPTPWMDIANALFKALNRPKAIDFIPMPADLEGKYQNYTCADMKKTKALLGQAAETAPLDFSCDRYVNQFLLRDEVW